MRGLDHSETKRRVDAWAARALRRASWRSALSIFVAVDGRTIGAILLADELRRETPRAVQALRAGGVSRIVMVTGDRAEAGETIDAARANGLPDSKFRVLLTKVPPPPEPDGPDLRRELEAAGISDLCFRGSPPQSVRACRSRWRPGLWPERQIRNGRRGWADGLDGPKLATDIRAPLAAAHMAMSEGEKSRSNASPRRRRSGQAFLTWGCWA